VNNTAFCLSMRCDYVFVMWQNRRKSFFLKVDKFVPDYTQSHSTPSYSSWSPPSLPHFYSVLFLFLFFLLNCLFPVIFMTNFGVLYFFSLHVTLIFHTDYFRLQIVHFIYPCNASNFHVFLNTQKLIQCTPWLLHSVLHTEDSRYFRVQVSSPALLLCFQKMACRFLYKLRSFDLMTEKTAA
jgi:hypothetical protein